MEGFCIEALTRALYVRGREGRGLERRGTEFAGAVIAVGWWNDPVSATHTARGGAQLQEPPELWYLVSEGTRPAPIWVSSRNLTEQVPYFGSQDPRRPD